MRLINRMALAASMALGLGGTAMAADLYVEPPVPVAVGGWYLRGAIGMSNQQLGNLDYQYFHEAGYSQSFVDDGSFDSAPTFELGAGYKFNDWFRADVTGQYRGNSSFTALDSITPDSNPSGVYSNSYSAQKSEWLFLANGYVDLGTYRGITPYIGAGIGASRNTISGFTDTNAVLGAGGYAGSESEWNFAWALHAGLGFQVTNNVILDLSYSYLNLGDASTATAYNYNPAYSRPNDGFKFEDITSHDFQFGVRYLLN
jgi:opacity protein-like surface antigen